VVGGKPADAASCRLQGTLRPAGRVSFQCCSRDTSWVGWIVRRVRQSQCDDAHEASTGPGRPAERRAELVRRANGVEDLLVRRAQPVIDGMGAGSGICTC
jgi:hypothetical protein